MSTTAVGLMALPETVRGLPLHALVVHATVVLVPLVALGAILCAGWPAARRRFGPLVLLGVVVTTALVPVTTSSGADFRRRLGAEELVRDHAEWGERLLLPMVVLLVATAALLLVDTLRRGATTPGRDSAQGAPAHRAGGGGLGVLERRITSAAPSALRTPAVLRVAEVVVAVLTVLAAAVALYVVFQTGESGTEAVWGGR